MDLSHQFTVPTGVEETWAQFQDIAGLAECFPGATVTEADGESFSGSVKVKLGPIALVYNGSGTFVEKDEAAHRFVVDAKGKDKRGNGTAGAVVTLSMAPSASGGGTDVDVRTDLNITGKPAQFGRGAMQDVSDKLLGQFVACLEQRLSTPEPADGPADEPSVESGEPAAASAGEPGAAPEPTPISDAAAAATQNPSVRTLPPPTAPRTPPPSAPSSASQEDDALDLGATVIPVLLNTYRTQIAAALGVLVAWLLLRRLRS